MTKRDGDYAPRDVVWAPVIHQRTIEEVTERTFYKEATYQASGKERPVLVIMQTDAQGGQHTLAFTTVKPKKEVLGDFFRDPRGEPWRFLKSHGFDVECYLNIAASLYFDRLIDIVRKEKRGLVDQRMFDEIIKQHAFRYLGMKL
jgi:hypothetical protein